jgi:uncharacterized protein YrrD
VLSDAELFGRTVSHVSGARLGRIDSVVHQLDGERLLVVRRRRLVRRWYFVSLDGATVRDGRVIVYAAYGRGRPQMPRAQVAS